MIILLINYGIKTTSNLHDNSNEIMKDFINVKYNNNLINIRKNDLGAK